MKWRHVGGGSVRARWRLLGLPSGGSLRAVAMFGHQNTEVVGLAQLGLFNPSLSAPLHPDALQGVLQRIAELTRMEVAELFLLDWQTGRMVLTAQHGPFASAFRQITQFPIGEDYPGLVAARGEPLATGDLAGDTRYLRTRGKERGFTSYACVPLLGPEGVLGSLHVASRRRRDDLASVLALLGGCARPLGAAVSTSLLQARDAIADVPVDPAAGVQRNLDHLLGQVLARMVAVSGARGGALALREAATGNET